MTTEPHVTLQQASNKVNACPQVLKATPGGQGKKFGGKGKGVRPPDKGQKNAVKTSTSGAVTSADPSSNLRSKLHDKSKSNHCDDTGINRRTTGYRSRIPE